MLQSFMIAVIFNLIKVQRGGKSDRKKYVDIFCKKRVAGRVF